MSKCINCIKQAVGRSKYCSDKCKVAWNRNKRNTKSVTVTSQGVTPEHPQTAPFTQVTPEQVAAQAEAGVKRAGVEFFKELANTAPTTQNTDEQEAGESTNSDEVKVEQPDEEWFRIEAVDDANALPLRVSKPTGQRTTETTGMTSQQLRSAIRSYRGTEWIASSEYAEVIHRLLTLSIERLDELGQLVPAWRLRMDTTAAPVSAEVVWESEPDAAKKIDSIIKVETTAW